MLPSPWPYRIAMVFWFACGLHAATPLISGQLAAASPLSEWSGLTASRIRPGTWWAINDSGNAPQLLQLDATLTVTAAWSVATSQLDWEDLAWADGRLFIADTGDNRRRRSQVQIQVVIEPDPSCPPIAPLPVERTYQLTFPTGPRDVEALVVCDRWLWLIDKRLSGAHVWRAARAGPDAQMLEPVPVSGLPAIVLAGDLAADGGLLALAHPLGVTVLSLSGGDLTTIDPQRTRTLVLPLAPQREAIAFSADGRDLLVGSEAGQWWRFQLTELLPAPAAAP